LLWASTGEQEIEMGGDLPMALTYRDFLSEDKDHAGVLYFGGARMALLDIEAGFWGLRRQVEALVGRRLTDAVLQQAGANGGASFARAFAPDVSPDTAAQALRDCIASYQAAGFGQFEIEVLEWPFGHAQDRPFGKAQDRPIGRVLIRGADTFEAWMMRQHGQKVDSPACAYTAGVLVGFVNVLAGRHDVVCIEHTCQAQGDQACLFELLPADAAGDVPVVALAPDPALGRQLNLLEMLFDRMPMGIAIFDRDYRLRRYNPTWASFADRYASPSASPVAPGVDYFEILPGAEPIVLPLFERVLAGETVRQEAVRLEVEGIVSYWDVVLAPLVEDATNHVQAQEALQVQVTFDDLITTISTNFINITLDEIDGAINRALQTISEFAGVDRSCVFLFSADKAEMDCTHEWCATGIAPQIQRMQGMPISSLAWSNAKIMRGEVMHIPRVADLPPEASAEQAEFQQQGTQSLVVVPMAYRGTVVGFLGFDSVRTEKTWSEESIKLLKIVGEIFINALEHKRAQAMQAGQRQFLELLARGGTLSETLHALVRIIEEQWPGMLGLILLLDEERQHLHHGASISLPEEYVQSIEGLQIGPMVGSCGTASYWGERVIVEDITTDPRWDGLRDLAIKYRLGACWSEPVFSTDGRVIATFAMYYRHPRAPTEAELRTIEIAAHLVGVAIEHRRAQEALQVAYQTLEQRVEERTREIERRRQVAEGLRDILARLNSNLALDEILDFIVDQANRLLDTSVVALYLLEGKDDLLTIQASRGLSLEYVESVKVAIGEGTIGRVVKERRPMVIPDVRKIAILVDEDDPSTSDSDVVVRSEQLDLLAKLASEFVAVLAVPLIAKDEIYGGLALYYPTPREFTDEEINLATAFADHAALAIENARLRIQEEQAAVMKERNRLARELHDSVSQALYGIGLGARTARTLLDRQSVDEETKARLANPLDYVLSLADAGLAEMRALIFELRLDALEKEGLVAALSKHAEALHARHKLDVHTEFCEEPELPLETKEALYRIAQEALNNVVKHAHASQVEIRLAVSPAERREEDREGAIALEIRDDGVGFDPQDEYPGHLGLQSMRERATRLGGTLEIESAPEHGTLLRVRIPFGCASLGYARDRQGRPPARTA
jgi:signal transduction histidine kinase